MRRAILIFSHIDFSNFSTNGNGFARSRRSLAEPPGGPPAIMGSGGGGINTGSTSTLTSNGHLHSYSNSYPINGNHHNNSISVNGGNNNGGGNDGNNNDTEQQQNIYEDIDQYQQREPPPMIAPISGVPNLKVGTINHIKFVHGDILTEKNYSGSRMMEVIFDMKT